MRKLACLVVLLLSVLGSGCSSKLMQTVDPESATLKVQEQEAGIVFLRSSIFGGGVQAPVVQADEHGNLSFVAILSTDTKYLQRTTPGRHFFVVGGEGSDMLEVNMEAGKTYYAYISPRLGFAKARFVFTPVTDLSKESFKKDLAGCLWVANTPEGNAWFTDNLSSLQKKYRAALQAHKERNPDKQKLLAPEHGTTEVLP